MRFRKFPRARDLATLSTPLAGQASGFVVCALENYLARDEGLSAFKAILAQERKVMAELESAEDPEVRRVGMRMVGRINDRPWTYVSNVVARVRAFVETPPSGSPECSANWACRRRNSGTSGNRTDRS